MFLFALGYLINGLPIKHLVIHRSNHLPLQWSVQGIKGAENVGSALREHFRGFPGKYLPGLDAGKQFCACLYV